MAKFEEMGINNNIENMAKLYYEIASEAEKLVKEYYTARGKREAFPIDIESIAKYLGITIGKESLNLAGTPNFSRKLAITSIKEEGVTIVADNTVGYKTQRYAIANGIGRYLLNQSKGMFKNTYAIPLIPQSLEEISADSIALFLMMPVTLFKDEFLHYLNHCNECPLNVDRWLEYLGDKCQITSFNLAIGYQQMKQVLCYQRQMEFENVGYDITKMPEDKYGKIFA